MGSSFQDSLAPSPAVCPAPAEAMVSAAGGGGKILFPSPLGRGADAAGMRGIDAEKGGIR